MTVYTARSLSTDSLKKTINQTTHGFALETLVFFNGTVYQKTLATSQSTCSGVLIVSNVLDANNFVATQVGYVSSLTGPFTPGITYYVSAATTGFLDINEPVAVGDVVLECFLADTSTSGWFWGGFGQTIESGALFAWQTITADQTLAVNNGYFCNGGAQLQLLLPATSAIGDEIKIVSLNSNGFSINQRNSPMQSIQFLGGSTTPGNTGSAATATSGDVVDIVCDITNVHWVNTGISGPTLLIT